MFKKGYLNRFYIAGKQELCPAFNILKKSPWLCILYWFFKSSVSQKLIFTTKLV